MQKNGCNKIILLTEFKSVSERQIPCFLPFVGPRFSTYDIKTEALKREEVGLAGEYGGRAGRVGEHGESAQNTYL